MIDSIVKEFMKLHERYKDVFYTFDRPLRALFQEVQHYKDAGLAAEKVAAAVSGAAGAADSGGAADATGSVGAAGAAETTEPVGAADPTEAAAPAETTGPVKVPGPSEAAELADATKMASATRSTPSTSGHVASLTDKALQTIALVWREKLFARAGCLMFHDQNALVEHLNFILLGQDKNLFSLATLAYNSHDVNSFIRAVYRRDKAPTLFQSTQFVPLNHNQDQLDRMCSQLQLPLEKNIQRRLHYLFSFVQFYLCEVNGRKTLFSDGSDEAEFQLRQAMFYTEKLYAFFTPNYRLPEEQSFEIMLARIARFLTKHYSTTHNHPLHDYLIDSPMLRENDPNFSIWQTLMTDAGNFTQLTKQLYKRRETIEAWFARPENVNVKFNVENMKVAYNLSLYENADANKALAVFCAENQVGDEVFEATRRYLQWRDNNIVALPEKLIPDIIIDGCTLRSDPFENAKTAAGYYWMKVPDGDTLALILGEVTHSCQSIGENADRCVREGDLYRSAGFYVLLKARTPEASESELTVLSGEMRRVIPREASAAHPDNIALANPGFVSQHVELTTIDLSQQDSGGETLVIPTILQAGRRINLRDFEVAGCSYAWVTGDQAEQLVLDSFEGKMKSLPEHVVPMMLKAFSKQVVSDPRTGIRRVTLGRGGQTPKEPVMVEYGIYPTYPQRNMRRGSFYSDAHYQYELANALAHQERCRLVVNVLSDLEPQAMELLSRIRASIGSDDEECLVAFLKCNYEAWAFFSEEQRGNAELMKKAFVVRPSIFSDFPEMLRDSGYFVLSLFENGGVPLDSTAFSDRTEHFYPYLGNTLKSSKAFVLKYLTLNLTHIEAALACFDHVDKTMLDDKEFLLALLSLSELCSARFPDACIGDHAFLKRVLASNPKGFCLLFSKPEQVKHLSKESYADSEMMLEVVLNQPRSFRNLPRAVSGDPHFVLALCTRISEADPKDARRDLDYVCEHTPRELFSNKDLVLALCGLSEGFSTALPCIHSDLFFDKAFVLTLLKVCPKAHCRIPDTVFDGDRDFTIQVAKLAKDFLMHERRFRHDKPVVLAVMEGSDEVYPCLPSEMQNDIDVVVAYVRQSAQHFGLLSADLKLNPVVFEAAVDAGFKQARKILDDSLHAYETRVGVDTAPREPLTVDEICARIESGDSNVNSLTFMQRSDKAIIRCVTKTRNIATLFYFNLETLNDRDFFRELVLLSPQILGVAPIVYTKDAELFLLGVATDPSVIQLSHPCLRLDPDFMLNAAMISPDIMDHCPYSLKNNAAFRERLREAGIRQTAGVWVREELEVRSALGM